MSTPAFFTQKVPSARQNKPEDFLSPDRGRFANGRASTKYYWQSCLIEFLELLKAVTSHFALLRGFLAELRSLPHRMKLQYKRFYDLYGVDVGPPHKTSLDEHFHWNTRTHACISDIENFLAAHPWATMIDVEFIRDAWQQGAEWGIYSSCNSAPENLASDASANSESGVPQLTKCDSLPLPPSRG